MIWERETRAESEDDRLVNRFTDRLADRKARVEAANHWNPPRVALCTCDWAYRGKTLHEVNAQAEAHVADGCEGCDHAIYIETITLPNAGERSPR